MPKNVREEEEDHDESESESDDGESDDAPEVSDEVESDDEIGEDTKQEEVIVNFEFFNMREADYHGLKCLLNSYLDGNQYDCSGLCDSIIKQSTVGSVIKSSEEDDPFAVFTVLSLSQHRSDTWLEQVKSHMKSSCKTDAMRKKLEETFGAQGASTGLIINERLMNSPPKLAPPLMQFLFQEIKAAATDSSLCKEERETFSSLKRYLIFTRVYSDPDRAPLGPSGSRKKQKREAGPSAPAEEGKEVIVYLRPEDEFLHKHSSWSFTFGVEGWAVGKDDLQPLRLLMMVEAAKIQKVRAELDSVVGNMASGQ